MSQELELHEIQGMVMSGHKHLRHAMYIFLQIKEAANAKAWLAQIALQIATSEKWALDPITNERKKPPHILNLGISFTGLQALGLPQAALESFPDDFIDGIASERRARILGDTGKSAPKYWQIGSDPNTLHILLVILALDEVVLQQEVERQKVSWEASGLQLIAEEIGHMLPDNREHFGFLDGVSQPKFKHGVRDPKASEPTIAAGEFVMGYENQYDQLPISPTLNGKDLGRNGTYIVFRKLYQDVVGFWNFVAEQAAQDAALSEMPPAERQVWLASKMVGRWPSGAPTVKYPDHDRPDIPMEEMNNFYYHKRDYDGYNTPRGSHIRRANPRDTNGTTPEAALKTSDSHLLIRRGMSYGDPLITPDTVPPQNLVDDGKDRGLIFLAINTDISRQFEFIHQSWLNNTKFDRLYNDKDPIMGDHCDDSEVEGKQYDFTIERQPVRRRMADIPRFVTVKGGGYFFMPSISALKLLAEAAHKEA